MKNVFIDAMFPELKGKHIYHSGRGTGSTPKAAVSRAFGDLMKHVKGKRVSIVKCTITIVEAVEQDTNEDEKIRTV